MTSQSPQRHVLVVEDNRVLAKLFGLWLLLEGYTVTVSHTGLRGIRLAQELAPDVIAWDVCLPDGDDTHSVISDLPHVPIVFMTGLKGVAPPAGAVLLRKPIEEAAFLRAIDSALRQRTT